MSGEEGVRLLGVTVNLASQGAEAIGLFDWNDALHRATWWRFQLLRLQYLVHTVS